MSRFDSICVRAILWVQGLSLIVCLPALAQQAETSPTNVRVMSFNVRYGTADDGEDRWDLRRDRVARVMLEANADLIGTQEMLPLQAEFLQQRLDQYTYVGRSREPENEDGEQCGVFFRRQRFVELERGSFWLSEHPEVPGSRGWDAALPRMATWLKFYDLKASRTIIMLNTHFDHRGIEARARSSALLREYAQRFALDNPLVVTGDFNAGEGSDPYQGLVADLPERSAIVFDTYRLAHPQRLDDEGTFNGFRGRTSGPRIDWILVSDHWQTVSAEIIRWQDDGRYPSDHFPVVAELRYAPSEQQALSEQQP